MINIQEAVAQSFDSVGQRYFAAGVGATGPDVAAVGYADRSHPGPARAAGRCCT
jgi:hypothetical protein